MRAPRRAGRGSRGRVPTLFPILAAACMIRHEYRRDRNVLEKGPRMSEVQFPDDFSFGAATAAYQIEGAWNEDGKGPSVWDTFVRRRGRIWQAQRGDVAVDHYHRYREDVALLAGLGANAYRFSVSWPRVLPEGRGALNERGLDFYRRLVDELLSAGITPFVTLYHWDLPQTLQERGGFAERDCIGWYADYVRIVVDALGDRVKHWITLNEPWVNAVSGFLFGDHAPGIRNPWTALRVAHNFLLANAAGYEVIKGRTSGSSVGVTLSLIPVYPMRQNDRDRAAARMANQFANDLFLDPLCHGSFPEPLWRRLGVLRPRVRPGDMEAIKGRFDFIGVNNYTRERAFSAPWIPFIGVWMTGRNPDGHEHVDQGVQFTSMGWEVFPHGMYEALMLIKERYGNPPIYVTENGAAFEDRLEDGRVRDSKRLSYLHDYLVEVRRAMDEGADVRGYFVWSLMDNFEWAFGYSKRFGLVHVDFPSQRRTVKESGHWFRELATSRRLPSVDYRGNGRG